MSDAVAAMKEQHAFLLGHGWEVVPGLLRKYRKGERVLFLGEAVAAQQEQNMREVIG